MKLLFDQNISFRLIEKISKYFPDPQHIKQLGLTDSTDKEIWKYAKNNDCAIVTFDADFFDLTTFLGHPPKIIWLRTGNRTTSHLAEILINRKEIIKEFLTDKKYKDIACIEIE